MRTFGRAGYVILFNLLILSPLHAQQSDYVVSQRLPLTSAANGVEGWLEVLTDSRLTADIQKEMWGTGDWSFVLGEDDPVYAMFQAKPPRNAKLRITNAAEKVIREFELERPLAKIEAAQLVSGRTTFLVAVDYSVGFGSYAGVTTQLLDVSEGKLQWISSKSPDGKDAEPIRLPRTLKSDWKMVPFKNSQDILWVYCRPAKVSVPGHEFVVGYVRFHFDGKQWVRYERQKNGFWESDQKFPAIAYFP